MGNTIEDQLNELNRELVDLRSGHIAMSLELKSLIEDQQALLSSIKSNLESIKILGQIVGANP